MFALDTDFNKLNPQALAESVATTLDDYNAQVTGLIEVEHDQDGHHTDITGASIAVTGDATVGDDASVGGDLAVTGNLTVTGSTALNGIVKGSADTETLPLGDTNDYDLRDKSILIFNTSTPTTVTGMANGVANRRLTLINSGTAVITLANNSGSSAAANQFAFFTDIVLRTLEAVEVVYTSSRWRLSSLGKQQSGVWNNVSFNAANFTASAGTWTLASGDQIVFRYMLIGKSLWIDVELRTTSTSAGMTTELRIALPASLTVVTNGRQPIQVSDNGGAFQLGMAVWGATQTYVRCYVDPTGSTNWTSGATDTTAIIGTIGPIEIT